MLDEIENIKKDIREYIEVRIDLLRIQAAENISLIISKLMFSVVVLLILSIVILFLSFAFGYFMASILHSNELGFLCVAGFYLVLLLLFLVFRKRIIDRPVIKSVMKTFFSNKTPNEKD
jgi:hypothetical protein